MRSTSLWIFCFTLGAILLLPKLNADDLGEPIDIGLIIEPGASHVSGYLDVLVARKGVRSVAVAVADKAMLQNAKNQLGKRFHGDGFLSAKRMLAKVRPERAATNWPSIKALSRKRIAAALTIQSLWLSSLIIIPWILPIRHPEHRNSARPKD